MGSIKILRHWTMKLPGYWGLGNSDIHASLLLTLGLISATLAGLAATSPSFYELHSAAISLPLVWTLSLAVRIAAQQLSIGGYSHEMLISVGPTGNLSTEYEYLPPGRIWSYSLAGQLATSGLLLVGVMVNAAMLPLSDGRLDMAMMFDFVSGWGSRAWATQIMWVNAFIALVNLFPTIPFDMRATCFALFSRRQRNVQEPAVFRRLASLDSHLAAVMAGMAGASAVLSIVLGMEIVAWYAAASAAVYLFVASRWERSRALDLEEQYAPVPPRMLRPEAYAMSASGHGMEGTVDGPLRNENPSSGLPSSVAGGALLPPPDIDEILRKLHREGADSLSTVEQQALLNASRELQQKRSNRTAHSSE
jgi:hypothetical protein